MTNIEPGARIHIVGIAGAGMSGLARLLVEMGCVVSGSDAGDTAVVEELRRAGVQVDQGHDPSHGASAQIVTWSPAVHLDNVELEAARQRHATLVSRADVLAFLAKLQPVIGLTGTHGKTTATSMMVDVLRAAGRDDSRLLGAAVPGVGPNGHWGGDALLLEVDESYGTFAFLAPCALGLLNVEPDHLDHYGTVEALEDAFRQLVDRTSGPVVLWNDDEGARRVAGAAHREVISVGAVTDALWRVSATNLYRRRASFTLSGPKESVELTLGVTGSHNVANAAVVAVLAREIGVDFASIREGLDFFKGAPRRFEYLGSWRGVDVYEDYAHLPGEIRATLSATRAAGYERITAVFQPHRVTRTERLVDSFATAFDDADDVVISDIYPAGEPNPLGVTGEVVAHALRLAQPAKRCTYAPTFVEVIDAMETALPTSDVIVLLGAGDIAMVARQLSGGLD